MAGDEVLPLVLDRPIVLVVGCGDLGMACARALANLGPLLVVDIDAERLGRCTEILRGEGYRVSGRACDVTSPEQVELLGSFLRSTPGVRVLAHIAAIGRSPLGWRHVAEVSLRGVHHVAGAVGPYLVAGGVGLFMSSIGSRLTPASPDLDTALEDPLHDDFYERLVAAFGREPTEDEAYQLSKRGVNLLATRLATTWGARQVRSLTVSPGIVDTTMARAGGTGQTVTDPDGTVREMTWDEMAGRIVPLGRRGIIPEVSGVVAFLASDGASFITGIDVPVDGGTLALQQPRGTVATGLPA